MHLAIDCGAFGCYPQDSCLGASVSRSRKNEKEVESRARILTRDWVHSHKDSCQNNLCDNQLDSHKMSKVSQKNEWRRVQRLTPRRFQMDSRGCLQNFTPGKLLLLARVDDFLDFDIFSAIECLKSKIKFSVMESAHQGLWNKDMTWPTMPPWIKGFFKQDIKKEESLSGTAFHYSISKEFMHFINNDNQDINTDALTFDNFKFAECSSTHHVHNYGLD